MYNICNYFVWKGGDIIKRETLRFPVSVQEAVQNFADSNPEAVANLLAKVEEEILDEARETTEHPEKRKELQDLCKTLEDIVKPSDGWVRILTPLQRKCLRHYVEVNVGDGTIMERETFLKFLNCLEHFSYCEWETHDEIVSMQLSFEGIYQ